MLVTAVKSAAMAANSPAPKSPAMTAENAAMAADSPRTASTAEKTLPRCHGSVVSNIHDSRRCTLDELWQEAMSDKLASIEGNDTWSLTDLPACQKPIGLKWVFKLKRDAGSNLVKHKVCLVTKGYVKRPGIDFDGPFGLRSTPAHCRRSVLVASSPHGREDGIPHGHISCLMHGVMFLMGTI